MWQIKLGNFLYTIAQDVLLVQPEGEMARTLFRWVGALRWFRVQLPNRLELGITVAMNGKNVDRVFVFDNGKYVEVRDGFKHSA